MFENLNVAMKNIANKFFHVVSSLKFFISIKKIIQEGTLQSKKKFEVRHKITLKRVLKQPDQSL
ncbi:hypothetical protein SY86_17105 [Erwinia tracheiphila]|uniref:Uncharacterized protein n=1 Tax=Erwinia tracheiphila TaxID=65700 RepID=A0A0M2KHG3_9GAMM|nr:hypothetical protein SY86_17105 [Erwinia tracheiphila]